MDIISNDFESLAENGFNALLTVFLGIALMILIWNVIKFVVSRVRRSRESKKNNKRPGKHRSNPWEEQWQKQQVEQARGQRAVTKEEHAKKQKELEERREMYRMQRKENQWKR